MPPALEQGCYVTLSSASGKATWEGGPEQAQTLPACPPPAPFLSASWEPHVHTPLSSAHCLCASHLSSLCFPKSCPTSRVWLKRLLVKKALCISSMRSPGLPSRVWGTRDGGMKRKGCCHLIDGLAGSGHLDSAGQRVPLAPPFTLPGWSSPRPSEKTSWTPCAQPESDLDSSDQQDSELMVHLAC